jgi:hypothetical protein
MMISEKHSAAARANGARSRGPVTPEGKAISSRNAFRHGMLAKWIVLPNEDYAIFEQYFLFNVGRFSPVDDVEMSMIEEMTAAGWRLRRCMAMERSILAAGIEQSSAETPMEQTVDAFRDPFNVKDLDRLERYQHRLQQAYQRALRGLAQMRKIANRDLPPAEPETFAPEPNEPSDPNVCNADPAPRPHPVPRRRPPQPSRSATPVAVPAEPDFAPPEMPVFP